MFNSIKKWLKLYHEENKKNNKFLRKFKRVKKDTLRKNKIKSLKRK